MERPCAYPKCPNTLSENVPLQIKLCSPHQYQLMELGRRLAREQLPRGDILFIFYHSKRCNARQLALYLGINPPTIQGQLNRGVIKGEKKGNPPVWQIPPEEKKRVVVLVRNYVTVWKAARDIGVDKTTLLAYVRQGWFGPYQVHLCGGLAIRKKELPGLREKYERIRREGRSRQRYWFRKHIKDGEITPNQIAKLLSMTNEGIHWWIKKGFLPYQKRKRYFLIKTSDFTEFAQRVINGEIPYMKSRTRKALGKFILAQNPP